MFFSVHAENINDSTAYLFVFHQDPTSSLYMATSRDGYTFTALNHGRPVMAGDTLATQHGIRDPHIYRGPDGAFYLSGFKRDFFEIFGCTHINGLWTSVLNMQRNLSRVTLIPFLRSILEVV